MEMKNVGYMLFALIVLSGVAIIFAPAYADFFQKYVGIFVGGFMMLFVQPK